MPGIKKLKAPQSGRGFSLRGEEGVSSALLGLLTGISGVAIAQLFSVRFPA